MNCTPRFCPCVHKVWLNIHGSLAATRHICRNINPLNAEINPIRHLLALVGARHIVHVSRITVKHSSVLSTHFISGTFLKLNGKYIYNGWGLCSLWGSNLILHECLVFKRLKIMKCSYTEGTSPCTIVLHSISAGQWTTIPTSLALQTTVISQDVSQTHRRFTVQTAYSSVSRTK